MSSDFTFTFQYENAKATLALAIVLPIVCTIVIALRFQTRRLQRLQLKADDWLALGALIPIVGIGICLIVGVAMKNTGYPTPSPPSGLTDEQLEFWLDRTTEDQEIMEYPFQILLVLALGMIKLSILFFYRRILVVFKGDLVDRVLMGTAVVVGLWTFTFEMLVVFGCGKHFWANWSSTGYQAEYCPIIFTSEYGLAISDLILDGFIFLIPIPLIWRLKLSAKSKLAVIGIFLLAASAVGCSVARLILYLQILNALVAEVPVDTNLLSTDAFYWSTLETGLSLIAACLPPMAYLVTNRGEYRLFTWRSTDSKHPFRTPSNESYTLDSPRERSQRSGASSFNSEETKSIRQIGRTIVIDIESKGSDELTPPGSIHDGHDELKL